MWKDRRAHTLVGSTSHKEFVSDTTRRQARDFVRSIVLILGGGSGSIWSYLQQFPIASHLLAMVAAGGVAWLVFSIRTRSRKLKPAQTSHKNSERRREAHHDTLTARTPQALRAVVKHAFAQLCESWCNHLRSHTTDDSIGAALWLLDSAIGEDDPAIGEDDTVRMLRVCCTQSVECDLGGKLPRQIDPSKMHQFKIFKANGNTGALLINNFKSAIEDEKWTPLESGFEDNRCIKTVIAAPVNTDLCKDTIGMLVVVSSRKFAFDEVDAEHIKAMADSLGDYGYVVSTQFDRLLQPILFRDLCPPDGGASDVGT